EAFVYSDWKIGARVNIDYHIELHGHYYSVPYALVHEHVDACLTATTVEIFHRGQRIAAHPRSLVRGQHTTDPAHMPTAHQHPPAGPRTSPGTGLLPVKERRCSMRPRSRNSTPSSSTRWPPRGPTNSSTPTPPPSPSTSAWACSSRPSGSRAKTNASAVRCRR